MSIIIAGAGGMVGSALVEALTTANVEIITMGREDLNYADFYKNIMNEEVLENLKTQNIQAIVNCAAYTNVDAAETDMLNCWSANAIVPQMLGHLALMLDVPIIHLSSDFVYSNAKVTMSTEKNELDPANFYGKSKLVGEGYLAGQTEKHYIIRTSWLFGGNKKTWIDNYTGENKIPTEYYLLKGSPTYVPDLIEAICWLLANNPEFGIYNFSNKIDAPVNKVEALQRAQEQAKLNGVVCQDLRFKKVVLAAPRGINTAMDINKFETLCYKVRTLNEAVEDYVAKQQ